MSTTWTSARLRAASDRATDRFIVEIVSALPQYVRYRAYCALHAAERRAVRRRRLTLAGAGTFAVVALGTAAMRRVKPPADSA